MRQARWTEQGIALAEVEPPPLLPGWVRLRVHACGICGSDLQLYRGGIPRPVDAVPGHEVAGIPTEGASGLPERLHAVEPRVWCGACDHCAAGSRHLCREGRILGLGLHAPGGLAEFMDVPRASLHPVDRSIPSETAAITEPLAVCVRAIHLARLEAASRVLVLGGGSIGLLSALLARDRCAEVAVTVRHPQQRDAAGKIGITPVSEQEAALWAAEREPDVVIETVGSAADTLADAIRLCRPGGRVVVLGVFTQDRPISALGLMAKELTVIGSNTYGADRRGAEFASAVRILPRYRDEISVLQTHRVPLSRLEEAFALASDKSSGAIKVTVVPG